jgi:hypothetical protein
MRRWLHPFGLAPSMRGQNCNGMLNRPATARWPAESSPRQAYAVLRAKRTLRADAGIRRALVRPIEFAGRSPQRPACVVGEQLRTDKIELWPLAPVEENQNEYGSGGGKAGEDCSLAWQDGRKAAGLHDFRKAARKPRATNVPHRLAALLARGCKPRLLLPPSRGKNWRRRWESNPLVEVLQTSAFPLGYSAEFESRLFTEKPARVNGQSALSLQTRAARG